MTAIAAKTKDADATLDYLFDWTNWMVAGDAIASYVVTISGSDSALTNPTSVLSTPTVRVWLTGGTVGVTYTIKCHITTSNSPARIDERDFSLKIT